MLSKKHILIFFTLIIVCGPALADLQCSVPGQCVNSELVHSGVEDNKFVCQDECKKNQDCNWFTFHPTLKFCQLFSDCLNITNANCDVCITSERDCTLLQCDIHGSCQGQVDHLEETDSQAKCLDLCIADPDCKWYTYDSASKVCQLFEDCSTIDEDCSSCISGERGCMISQSMTKVLITTGTSTGEPPGKISEVIDIENPNQTCDDYFEYPGYPVYAAVGGMLSGNRPFLCGGFDGDVSNRCYILGDSNIQALMLEKRVLAAGIVTNDGSGLWITGGLLVERYNSTEYVYPGKDSVPGPTLPTSMEQHCLVQLDDETYMILGGLTPLGVTSNTFFFHTGNQTFTPGPKLTRKKTQMQCGVIETDDGSVLVVVAGGGYDSIDNNKDEIEAWTFGSSEASFTKMDATLPKPIEAAGVVITSDKKSMIIIGGYSISEAPSVQGSLIQVSCSSSTSCQTETMEQQLRIPRWYTLGMLVPDHLVNCH